MRTARALRGALTHVLIAGAFTAARADAQPAAPIDEITIAALHTAMRTGTLSCHDVVATYLRRIATYDRSGPAINALVVTNPDALRLADSLDVDRRRRPASPGPLHCVPVIVKDNFETAGLATTAGSLSLAGYVPTRDATMVARLRAAGAIVLAKSNMAEFAFSPYETVSSILPGYTRNPYALDRVTAGSSGGTAAAVAANFGEVGLGTDTGNSIRGPSSHLALVGIRSTMGLTSRAGVVPLNLAYDVAGPMARTVADAVAVFQVVAGCDPADSTTAPARTHPTPDYTAALRPDALHGARLGVLRQAYLRPSAAAEVLAVFDRAVGDLRRAGATVLDSVPIPELDALLATDVGECNRFRYDLERWMASTGGRTPVHALDEIVRSRRFHPSIETRLTAAQRATVAPEASPGCAAAERRRDGVRAAVAGAMDRLHLDALVYPTWSNPPRLIGDLNTPAGDNSQLFAPLTGWPAVQVPMGATRGTLPAGLTLLGRAWSEVTLFPLAYAYEQATRHRRPPASTPPLPADTGTTAATPPGAAAPAIATDPPHDAAHPARMEVLHIPSGGVRLNGVAYLAAGAGAHPTVILLHGLPGNEKNLDLAQAVRRAGWHAITLNYRGSWGSPGAFRFGGTLDDAAAVLAFLRTPATARSLGIDTTRLVLAGHSMGGWATALTAARDPGLRGAVLISAADMGLAGVGGAASPAARRALAARMADNMESLAGVTAAEMADELIAHGEAWRLARAEQGLARTPLLALTSDDGLAPQVAGLVAAVRAGGNARVTARHVATDHGWSDRRIALETAVVQWLETVR